MLSNEEINSLAVRFKQLKTESEKTKDYKEFNRFQNYCMKALEPLVNSKTFKYKRFSNHPDLKQDGFEALLHSFDNYDCNKGDFAYWALQYIQTKVYRSANAHSTIKIPLKKTNDFKPFKMEISPTIEGDLEDPVEMYEKQCVRNALEQALDRLPDRQRQVVTMYYCNEVPVYEISSKLDISRQACLKILKRAENNIKRILENRV